MQSLLVKFDITMANRFWQTVSSDFENVLLVNEKVHFSSVTKHFGSFKIDFDYFLADPSWPPFENMMQYL